MGFSNIENNFLIAPSGVVPVDLFLRGINNKGVLFVEVSYPASSASSISIDLFKGAGGSAPFSYFQNQTIPHILGGAPSSIVTFENAGTSYPMETLPTQAPFKSVTPIIFIMDQVPDWNRVQLTNNDPTQTATVILLGDFR